MMKNLKNSLINLGLGEFDSEVYLALLKRGEAPVGELSKALNAHRELIYGAMNRLIAEGLVLEKEKKKIKHYQALEPKTLVSKIREKEELASSILPDLNKLFTQPDVTIQILEGAEGYEEVQKDIQRSLKDKETYFVIGGAGNSWFDIVKPYYMKYRKLCLKRGIHLKSLSFPNEAKGIVDNEPKGFCEVRVLPENFQAPSSTKVYADRVAIQVFGERPFVILIKSKAVSEAYWKYFDSLWEVAKKSI